MRIGCRFEARAWGLEFHWRFGIFHHSAPRDHGIGPTSCRNPGVKVYGGGLPPELMSVRSRGRARLATALGGDVAGSAAAPGALGSPSRRTRQNGGATCRLRLDEQLATDQLQTFLHAGQAESQTAVRRIDVE